jgi:cbb3-type cytochrome oxidase subunit 1
MGWGRLIPLSVPCGRVWFELLSFPTTTHYVALSSAMLPINNSQLSQCLQFDLLTFFLFLLISGMPVGHSTGKEYQLMSYNINQKK